MRHGGSTLDSSGVTAGRSGIADGAGEVVGNGDRLGMAPRQGIETRVARFMQSTHGRKDLLRAAARVSLRSG